jgi:hypothetical protein
MKFSPRDEYDMKAERAALIKSLLTRNTLALIAASVSTKIASAARLDERPFDHEAYIN